MHFFASKRVSRCAPSRAVFAAEKCVIVLLGASGSAQRPASALAGREKCGRYLATPSPTLDRKRRRYLRRDVTRLMLAQP